MRPDCFPELFFHRREKINFVLFTTNIWTKRRAHLAAGWRYTNTLPFNQFRVRLACAWPVLIGLRTIDKLRAASVTQLQQRVKVSRLGVWQIILLSILASPFPMVWRRLSRTAR